MLNLKRSKFVIALKALIETAKDHFVKILVMGVTCTFNILTGGNAMAEKIGEFFSTHGLFGSAIIILTIVITALIKYPIKNAAIKWAERNGYGPEGKKRITQWVSLIPFVISFFLSFIYVLWREANWVPENIDWFNVSKYGIAYATTAIASYDVVKGFVQAYALKKTQILSPTPTETTANEEISQDEINRVIAEKEIRERQAREKAAAEAEAKAKAKQAKREAKAKAKKIKKYNDTLKRIGKEQATLESLDLNPEDIPQDDPVTAEEVAE